MLERLFDSLTRDCGYNVAFGVAHPGSQLELDVDELELMDEISSERRKRQFEMGRLAAQQLLKALGATPGAVLQGMNGEPLWPDSRVWASISHTDDIGICAGLRHDDPENEQVLGIGVDIESSSRLISMPTYRRIFTQEERNIIRSSKEALRIFSLKEAVYKAAFSGAFTRLSFKDVSIQANEVGAIRVQAELLSQSEKVDAMDGELALFCAQDKGYIVSLALLLKK